MMRWPRFVRRLIGWFATVYFVWRYGLPPRLNRAYRLSDIAVEMPDGVVLMTDVYQPSTDGKKTIRELRSGQ